jgi:phosphate acetyltransferase
VSFVEALRARAATAGRRIAFPESTDERTLAAVGALASARIVHPVLVGTPAARARCAAESAGIEWADPATHPHRARAAEWIWERRRAKGLTKEQAEVLVLEPLFFADALVALEDVDGCVAGATNTTADVMHAALWTIGPAPGVETVSSAFYMVVSPFRGETEEVLTFSDCAVVRDPSPAQLADIAVAAAADRRRIIGDEPRVAFLSYGTLGSGAGPSVEKVRTALALLRARSVDFLVDGELQGDAALIPAVGERKAPASAVAGRANVLIFPSLDAGNIAYKLVERIARARAIGPIVQGLARPCNDLSRGASADDIINVAAITALQATGAGGVDVGGFRRETDQ